MTDRTMSQARAAGDPQDELHTITDIMERLQRLTDRAEIRISAIVDALGAASLPALLLVPAFLVVTPISGVPGVSVACGIMIALIAGQMLLGRRAVWLPDWVMRKSFAASRLKTALSWIRKPAQILDRITARRLVFLIRRPFVLLPRAICTLCGAAMPVFEIVPFTSSMLGVAVSIFAVAFVACDGLFALLGLAAFTGVGVIVANVLLA